MCLPCWNFTAGAFAVFGCFERLKCCGLSGLPTPAVAPVTFPPFSALPGCPCAPDKLLLRIGHAYPSVLDKFPLSLDPSCPDRLPLTFSWGRLHHPSHARPAAVRAAPFAPAFSSVCFLLVARRT